MTVQSAEDYEAYLKWCEENRARQAEFQQQQKLLDEFKAREAAKAEEARKMRVKQEAEERQHNMMAEWKNWERQMQHVASFDKLGSAVSWRARDGFKLHKRGHNCAFWKYFVYFVDSVRSDRG